MELAAESHHGSASRALGTKAAKKNTAATVSQNVYKPSNWSAYDSVFEERSQL